MHQAAAGLDVLCNNKQMWHPVPSEVTCTKSMLSPQTNAQEVYSFLHGMLVRCHCIVFNEHVEGFLLLVLSSSGKACPDPQNA